MTDEPLSGLGPSDPPVAGQGPGPSCTVFGDDASRETDRWDALADVLAGEADPEVVDHVADCPVCSSALADLQAALPAVAAALAGLPAVPSPAGLQDRLSAALAADAGAHHTATVLPLLPDRRRGWLPWAGGLAAAAVLVVGGLVLAGRGGSPEATTTSSAAAPIPARPVLNSTGTDYGRDGKALAAALPALLAGPASGRAADSAPSGGSASPHVLGKSVPAPTPSSGPQDRAAPSTSGRPSVARGVGADPLARLRTVDGLASCLSSLTTPDVPGSPLAVDYAAFDGQPALVVVLPSTRIGKVDVFVLGADCSAQDAKVLFFSRVSR